MTEEEQSLKGVKAATFSGISSAILVATLLAVSNCLWLMWYWFDFYRQVSLSISHGSGPQINTTLSIRLFKIALCLIITAFGLWLRKLNGLYLSLGALIWLIIEYINWYSWSRQTLENAGLLNFPVGTSHVFNLYGATGWNAVVFIIASSLFIWIVSTLIRELIIKYY